MLVGPGDTVAAGDVVAVVEAMKTEVSVTSPGGGRVVAVRSAEGALVHRGADAGRVGIDTQDDDGSPLDRVRATSTADRRPRRRRGSSRAPSTGPRWRRAPRRSPPKAALGRPLYGVPALVKDNIALAGVPTGAGCPAYAPSAATESATAVVRLEDAGALVLGTTNMDQFATGLVGTRSPYGAPRNPVASGRIPGGSSSGSAVAVALGLVPFAVGTDTAGSGRVPAACTNTVGFKPTAAS